jgi:hypothetical protein
MTNESTLESKQDENFLGLSTSQLAGLTVDELLDNKTAITMVIHYYKQLVSENVSLKNETNTLRTYVDSYERKKIYASIGSILLAASNVLVGFGVNLLTPSTNWPGIATLISGILLIGIGLYFSCRD